MLEIDRAILEKVAVKWRDAFRRFVESGEAPPEFLAYLDESEDCQAALEAAIAAQARALVPFGPQLARVFANETDSSEGERAAWSRHLVPALSGLAAFGGIAAAVLAFSCVYLWGGYQEALQREAAWRLRCSQAEAAVAEAISGYRLPRDESHFAREPVDETLPESDTGVRVELPADEAGEISRDAH